MESMGINPGDLERYIQDFIYNLPGLEDHQEYLTVLLTGSRALGRYTETSDVDLEVLCTREIYNSIQQEMLERGLTTSLDRSLYYLPQAGWEDYFHSGIDRPHFTITPIEEVKRQLREYEDVPMWVWTNALIINDPNNQFHDLVAEYSFYPREVLRKKLKYRYLLSSYWLIDGYPHNHRENADYFPALQALVSGIHELYRFFYLAEGRPYPYSEKLVTYAGETRLGQQFKPFLDRVTDLILGRGQKEWDVWKRLDLAIELLIYWDKSPDAVQLGEACDAALRDAGIDEDWVVAGYDNIDELLLGRLGPTP